MPAVKIKTGAAEDWIVRVNSVHVATVTLNPAQIHPFYCRLEDLNGLGTVTMDRDSDPAALAQLGRLAGQDRHREAISAMKPHQLRDVLTALALTNPDAFDAARFAAL